MIYFTQGISDLPDVSETAAVAAELQEDLRQLKPNMIMETLRGWTPALLTLAYRIAIAALIVLVGIRITVLVRKFFKRSFERMGIDISLSKFLISCINAVCYAVILFMALEKIGIPSASIVALLGSATLAIGLSLQGSLSNFAGGILILVLRPFKVEDYIICEGVEGTVLNIGLVYTTLLTVDNKKITIPNGSLSNNVIINVTAQDRRRLDLTIGISYTADIKKAKAILDKLYREDPQILQDQGVTVFVDQLADSAVILGVRGWTATEDYWSARWRLTEQIKEEFDAAGIEIPFNQVDVHVRS